MKSSHSLRVFQGLIGNSQGGISEMLQHLGSALRRAREASTKGEKVLMNVI